MALLAEELVEEWLNRQGYFTIRGIKFGVHEIDLLAIRPQGRQLECRHVEVQASVRPVSYLTKVPRSVQETEGRASGSAKRRTPEELAAGVQEWVEKKFFMPEKQRLRTNLAPGPWSLELVVHKLKYPEELPLIRQHGIITHALSDVVQSLKALNGKIAAAAGAAFADLVLLEESLE